MSDVSSKRSGVAVIVGAGSNHDKYGDVSGLAPEIRWGLGGALALRFAKEYQKVVLMGRSVKNLQPVVDEIAQRGGDAVPIAVDVTSDESVKAGFEQAKQVGDVDTLVFNAAPPFPPGITFANMPVPHKVDASFLQKGFDIGVTGCLRCVQQVIDPMLEAKRGTILLTGATQALRGMASFASMSPIKFALRSLAQSMAQCYAPQGVHVAHVVIDGPIDSSGLREQLAGQDIQFLNPAEIADAYMMLVDQPKSCWSYELQLTPNTESWGMRL